MGRLGLRHSIVFNLLRIALFILDLPLRLMEAGERALHSLRLMVFSFILERPIEAVVARLARLEAREIIVRILEEPEGALETRYAGYRTIVSFLLKAGFREVSFEDTGVGGESVFVSETHNRRVIVGYKEKPWGFIDYVVWRPLRGDSKG